MFTPENCIFVKYLLARQTLYQLANALNSPVNIDNDRTIELTYDEITLDGSYLVPLHEYQLIEISNN